MCPATGCGAGEAIFAMRLLGSARCFAQLARPVYVDHVENPHPVATDHRMISMQDQGCPGAVALSGLKNDAVTVQPPSSRRELPEPHQQREVPGKSIWPTTRPRGFQWK